MSIARSLTASLALAGTATALQYLAPVQDINLPSSESAKEPLQWLGANGPYHAGRQSPPFCPIAPLTLLTLEKSRPERPRDLRRRA